MTYVVSTAYGMSCAYQQFLVEQQTIKENLDRADFDQVVDQLSQGLNGKESLLQITRVAWAKVTAIAKDSSTVSAEAEKKAYLKNLVLAYVSKDRKEYKENQVAIDTAVDAVMDEARNFCCSCVIL